MVVKADRASSAQAALDSYGHAHSLGGAREALRILLADGAPESVLDVGCGTGTWLRASLECGATEVIGVDGADLPEDVMFVPKQQVLQADLNRPLRLDRRFDLVLCLEAAEHLERESAGTIIDTLTAHGDRILFSAAAPGQPGLGHINCQWPSYWQQLFNARGYACNDAVRWIIWDNGAIEPWYRQNLMLALRDEGAAGREPRIRSVLHPEMVACNVPDVAAIEKGQLPWQWYATAPLKAAAAKIRRRLF